MVFKPSALSDARPVRAPRLLFNFCMRYPSFVLELTATNTQTKISENYVPIPVALITTTPPLSSVHTKPEHQPEHLTKRTATMPETPTATIEVYRVALYDQACPLIVATWREVIEHLSEYEGDDLFDGGERISITKTSMSAEAFAALPEWDGP